MNMWKLKGQQYTICSEYFNRLRSSNIVREIIIINQIVNCVYAISQ